MKKIFNAKLAASLKVLISISACFLPIDGMIKVEVLSPISAQKQLVQYFLQNCYFKASREDSAVCKSIHLNECFNYQTVHILTRAGAIIKNALIKAVGNSGFPEVDRIGLGTCCDNILTGIALKLPAVSLDLALLKGIISVQEVESDDDQDVVIQIPAEIKQLHAEYKKRQENERKRERRRREHEQALAAIERRK